MKKNIAKKTFKGFIYLVVFSFVLAMVVLISLKMIKTETQNPTTADATDPTTSGPTDPTTAEPTESTTTELTDPTTPNPTDLTSAGPTKSTADPTNPTTAEPTDPTTPNPTDPTSAEPIDPTTAKPTDPTTTNPTDPTTADPTNSCEEGHVFYFIDDYYNDVNEYPGDYFDGYIGDGFCDDVTNIAECNHDGGDCCGDDVNTDFCNECICNQTNQTNAEPTDSTTAGTTDPTIPTNPPTNSCEEGTVFDDDYYNDYPGIDLWLGDGFCDDITNIPECNHDGGDCCGDDVKTSFCNECICKQ